MLYTSVYKSPIGDMLIACDDEYITGLWFFGSKYFADSLSVDAVQKQTPVIRLTKQWLDAYFAERDPGEPPPFRMFGTPFQLDVWDELCKIPYGETVSYGDIAKAVASRRGVERMSPQAVGGAVGRNRISIIVPCHRVIAADKTLCGYAGGLDIKKELLRIEGVNILN